MESILAEVEPSVQKGLSIPGCSKPAYLGTSGNRSDDSNINAALQARQIPVRAAASDLSWENSANLEQPHSIYHVYRRKSRSPSRTGCMSWLRIPGLNR